MELVQPVPGFIEIPKMEHALRRVMDTPSDQAVDSGSLRLGNADTIDLVECTFDAPL